MFRQETSGHVERMNRVARGIEKLLRRDLRFHHAHVVRADAVVVERQRVEQDAPSIACERLSQLSDYSLRRAADLVTKHDHDVAGGVCDDLSCGIDLTRFDTCFLRGECIVP